MGKVVAVKDAGSRNGRHYWLFHCDCGNEFVSYGGDFSYGRIQSCGHCNRGTHNKTKTRLYSIWNHMKQRCGNPKDSNYKYYGERGIEVCEEWKSDYSLFEKWALSNGYTDELTIDRIDNDGNYCPENCRWTTMEVQVNNKRNRRPNLYITYKGETLSIKDAAEKYGISYSALKNRIYAGWNIEDAIEKPAKNKKQNRISAM